MMRADLIELLTSRIGQDFDGECHLTEQEARDIIDALASLSSPQEPVAWQPLDQVCHDMLHALVDIQGMWKTISPGAAEKLSASIEDLSSRWFDARSMLRVASPVEPVVAAKAEEGWIPIETAPKDSVILVRLGALDGATFAKWSDGKSIGFVDHPAGYWVEQEWAGDRWTASLTPELGMSSGGWNITVNPTGWMPLPAAPTCEGEGQP